MPPSKYYVPKSDCLDKLGMLVANNEEIYVPTASSAVAVAVAVHV